MGRRKVTHQLIADNATRRVTFRKRKDGLLKKINELTILCGLPACAIIYSEYKDGPELWPNVNEVRSLLDRLSELPVEKQTKYMMDQKDLMKKMIQEAEKKLEKEKWYTRAMKLGIMASTSDLTTDTDCSEELAKAAEVVDKKLKAIRERIKAVEAGAPIIKRE
ncbi:PREDICTED: agamous-like MADS-box protein AGL80 [Camelina sativa]|uniref:Agamous-like MADS-box protein AGL80 n=1 Tax=Camelina sativa TaxID=90675 RepID=A0ABM0VRC0_CAMSA|nr:PREDICTED: agamous-like MADS-box protein AGL80 [Camelina sativa]